jgi:drug/metabolite transporter (DMT)-like permease
VAVVVIASVHRNGGDAPGMSDMYALIAAVTASIGYAEGGRLTAIFGPAKPLCWTIAYGVPVALVIALFGLLFGSPVSGEELTTISPWLGLLYIAAVSSMLAFIPWNIGLAMGGTARVAQMQLLQPLLTLIWSVLVLQDAVSIVDICSCLIVIGCVILGTTRRLERNPTPV